MKELINRWNSEQGKALLAEIIKNISMGIPLESIIGLNKYLGRWDLRGAKLSKIETKQKIESGKYDFIKTTGTFRVKNITLESIDFSFADISYSVFENTILRDCLFDNLKGKELRFIACHIENCSFFKSNISYSFINENVGSNSGHIKNVKFVQTNLAESIFYFPIVEDCIFSDCNLIATNFDGSRMKNCKFIGKVDSAFFNGYSLNANKSVLLFFNKINPMNFLNPMENIDFSEAQLIGVTFKNGIDLSKCKFPKNENYIVIKNANKTFLKAKEKISIEWDGEDKRIALYMIEKVYYTNEYFNQSICIIDKYLIIEQFGEIFADKLFHLIADLNV